MTRVFVLLYVRELELTDEVLESENPKQWLSFWKLAPQTIISTVYSDKEAPKFNAKLKG